MRINGEDKRGTTRSEALAASEGGLDNQQPNPIHLGQLVPLTIPCAIARSQQVVADSPAAHQLGLSSNVPLVSLYHTATATRSPVRRDPLAIDLDGDSIETVGITANPVLFDHNADGIKTGTGWVKGDDAWLVLDRDGNGTIDSGRELFGVDTVLSGTPGIDAVYASSGFEALRALDTNHDNVFDASDEAFTQVRLWQDLNQDGISQSNELFTLAQKNIASISLNANSATTNLGNGNTVYESLRQSVYRALVVQTRLTREPKWKFERRDCYKFSNNLCDIYVVHRHKSLTPLSLSDDSINRHHTGAQQ